MKVISIIQPWATLIALGEKKFETRSWSTKYRGELAIHASKKIDKAACRQEPFRSVLAKHGYDETNLPIGKILGMANLEDCYETKPYGLSDYVELKSNKSVKYIDGQEFAFGDFTQGRFAWELLDVKMLDKPIPAKGQLGLWNYQEAAL